MPSIYTDEERSRRYGELRERKKWLDRAYSISMWITLGLALFLLLPSIYLTFMQGMFLFQISQTLNLLLLLLMFGLQICGIYARRWQITAGAAAAAFIMSATDMKINGIRDILHWFITGFACVTVFVFVCHYAHHKLSQEEGYPDFDISYEERAQQKKQMEARQMHRILQEEAKPADPNAESDMTDLLDEAQRTAPAALTAYRDRHTLNTHNAGEKQYVPGEMDEL